MFSAIPIWIRAAILAGATVVGALAGWWFTSDHYQGVIAKNKVAHLEALREGDKLAREQQSAADKITHDRDVANAIAQQQIRYVTKTIIRKVPTYVTTQTDADYPIPCGALRLHDAAARGVDPATVSLPAGKSDADNCDVKWSVASAVIADNYGTALGWKADLQNWASWYVEQKTAYDAYIAKLKGKVDVH